MSSFRRFAEWRDLSFASREQHFASALRHAQGLEPRLHAFVEMSAADGPPPRPGRLQSQSYAAKDLFITGSHRPRAGLKEPITFDAKSATALSLLDNAGARCLGFTAMTELAYEPSGYSAVCERAHNPWNLDCIPGGSSSGSAVAVASGSAVFALGSDTGGSIRIPAHCCGITGWKPTWSVATDSHRWNTSTLRSSNDSVTRRRWTRITISRTRPGALILDLWIRSPDPLLHPIRR